tara:strand:- start:2703 stop:2996 length:294 start_codon:yes stop_codon:yes gene_type:complete
MIGNVFLLIVLYLIFKYSVSWVVYYNSLDSRFGKSIWRWTYDYPVKGIRDVSDLDDKNFVRKRRKRNRAVSAMYWIFFLTFLASMSFLTKLLFIILE